MTDKERKIKAGYTPLYSEVRQLLPVLEGAPKARVVGFIRFVDSLRGTPQSPLGWSDPDTWIPERLSEEFATLATDIWRRSERTTNPRYLHNAYAFINAWRLLEPDSTGIYRLSQRGQGFLAEDKEFIRAIDETDGLIKVLLILSTKGQVRRGDILDEWSDFLRDKSKFTITATIGDALWRRLQNLVERGLVSREGHRYSITPAGQDYMSGPTREKDHRKDLTRAVKVYNDGQVEKLREKLATMPPKAFEHLTRDLLEAMGYEDVEVTKESGDKGVDVVATVQFGITTLTEVVQVKRHQGSIGRPVMDQLRGVLPFFKALRGTIITTGSFSKGCVEAALFPGAAPIGLIDGKRLLELLVEHGIGVKKRETILYEVDEAYFTAPVEEDEEGPLED